MRERLLLLAAICVGALALSACQGYSGDAETYKRDHDRYMRTLETKTGGPDL